jgi:purine-binding chemotaxis protein CheW
MTTDKNMHNDQDYVTMYIAGQLFGIPVLQVQDIMSDMALTKVPLAPPEVAGALNLRGRIVTAIDMRCKLGLPHRESGGKPAMHIVVEQQGEMYSLLVDKVGDVTSMPDVQFEPNPSTLDPQLREVSKGIYQLTDTLLVILDITLLLKIETPIAA